MRIERWYRDAGRRTTRASAAKRAWRGVPPSPEATADIAET